jgi:hypothetical protein
MKNKEQLIQIINEVIQQSIPTIVESVSARLVESKSPEQNKTIARKNWELLSPVEISNLAVSDNYIDRCRAASHPNITFNQMSILFDDADYRVRRAVRKNPNFNSNPLIRVNSESATDERLQIINIVEYTKLLNRFSGDNPISKKNRQKIRTILEKRIKDDTITLFSINNPTTEWEIIFNNNSSAKNLEALTKHSNYNVCYFANVMLERMLKQELDLIRQEGLDLLTYFINSRSSCIKFYLNDL